MRLIDLDKAKAALRKSHYHHAKNSREACLLARDIVILNEQPTAYDVDKVVDRLRDYAKYKGILRVSMSAPAENYVPISVVIDIVENGGSVGGGKDV